MPIECAHAIVKSIKIKNRQNHALAKMFDRISIINLDVFFDVIKENEENKLTITTDVSNPLNKLDQRAKFMGVNVVFTKSILSNLPLDYRLRYRYLGSVSMQKGMKEQVFEDIDVYQKDVNEKLFRSKKLFERGVISYENQDYERAIMFFENVLKSFPNDKSCYIYFNKAKEKISRDKL